MNEELLAPPKLRPRTVAILSGVVASIGLLVLSGLAMAGRRSMTEFVYGAGAIITLNALNAALYWRLLKRSATVPPEKLSFIHWAVFVVSMTAYMGTFGILIYGSVIRGLREQSTMIVCMSGFFLAQAGWSRRVGETRHCPQCEYEFGFVDDADAPIRCPECGTGWLGRLKKGRRVRSRKLVAFGICFAIVSLVVLNPIFYFTRIASRLTTPMLFAGLYASPRSGFTAWDELAKRPLDPAWAAVMARYVLALRLEDPWIDTSSADWFESAATANQIPQTLIDRFYHECLAAELHLSKRVKSGEAFTVSLRVTHAARCSRGATGIYFAGYAIDDEAPLAGRLLKTTWEHEYGPRPLSRSRDVFAAELVAPQATEFRVRAVFWLVHKPSFIEELQWQSDGTPVEPPSARWFERREVVGTVRVER